MVVIPMIRLVQRRLIIPQGDTGTFTIPTQGEVENGDKAIFAIYDNLMHKTILEKEIDATNETLTFTFESNDTLFMQDGTPIEPDDRGYRYSWDITLKRANSVDSYYAAFGLPPCIIKRVTRNVQE